MDSGTQAMLLGVPPYPCYRPPVFPLLTAILTERHRLRQLGQFARADQLRDLAQETAHVQFHDRPYGSLFADVHCDDPVTPWAFFFRAARGYGVDVQDVAGTARDWATSAREAMG